MRTVDQVAPGINLGAQKAVQEGVTACLAGLPPGMIHRRNFTCCVQA